MRMERCLQRSCGSGDCGKQHKFVVRDFFVISGHPFYHAEPNAIAGTVKVLINLAAEVCRHTRLPCDAFLMFRKVVEQTAIKRLVTQPSDEWTQICIS